jgi:UTP--glucose-1-phosphate uridylyltransferase
MLAIGNLPVIHFLINELLLAQVKQIAFVTLPGDNQLRRYFTESPEMRQFFERCGWSEKYRPIYELHHRLCELDFHWIEQPMDGRYWTAIPAIVARKGVGSSEWLLLSGDDLVLREDGGSDIADLIAARTKACASAAIQVATVPMERVSRYGVIRTRIESGHLLFDGAVEKPRTELAPSNLASISRFLLQPDFYDFLDKIEPDLITGEFQSISAIINYAKTKSVLVHKIAGQYHDCGQPNGWLAANIAAQKLGCAF